MATAKTDEFVREEVISWYEEKYEIKLARIRRIKRKVLRDEKGRLYCFITARENGEQCHGLGLDPKMLANEKDWNNGLLIIGICHTDKICIYQESLKQILQRKDLLTRGNNFKTVEKEGQLYVYHKGVPEFIMTKIGETSDIRTVLEKAKKDPELMSRLKELLQIN